MLEVDREQVVAYRIARQGLHRAARDAAALAVFDLGLQSTQRDTAEISVAARFDGSFVDDDRFVLAWTHRGAPHFHRAGELAEVTRALVPLDEADAMARMGWQRREVEAAGMSATDGLFTAARAIRKVVDRPMTKGAVSTEITKLVPAGLSYWCRRCQATHILEQVMRLAAIHGGARLEAGVTPATLAPIAGRGRVRTTASVADATAVVARYLSLHGPATATEAAGFIGTTATTVKKMWPSDLVEVRFDGRKTVIPAGDAELLANPPEPDVVRLLPPWDPYLQSRDRATLVPDKARQKEIWKIIGNPGAVLADGEVAGVWRTKGSGRKRLDFTITAFDPLTAAAKKAVEGEAERVARVREFEDSRLNWKA
ncbi:winged helix DNA-binding domain-containing protein [Amycolatopsis alkalitolerans]|uniref:Winged helix DNA-binding domain-containing protein n=1 Tax=Amycolatopsis alkalitolerans TaxID=2547244 RepID=A0A5C4LWT4_9PSEU|nr:winged helix DNA-binding domain-containing protein [Amycolatopsis alkalitolerans]TNC23177.1 winged helix DNA-binding domain-containing protein [Amycolatopsis alkalitolerans]